MNAVVSRLLMLVMLLCAASAPGFAQDLPRLEQRGSATQLIVNGEPYIMLAGELHNSSASSPEYMEPIWERLAENDVRTVLSVVSWELVEPEEGRFDFSTVDAQIAGANRHGIKLVLLWFGAFKNAESTYAPSWVRRDEERFPRAERDPEFQAAGIAAYLKFNPVLSVFSEELVRADARAFARLMRHVRQVDREGTVIMTQVQNEVGLLAESRDRSPLAQAAWTQQVPPELMDHLHRHRDDLAPHLRELWARQGFRRSGTWGEVFGSDKLAEEVFMAWHFARYVDYVARAGLEEYPLPMYANAWLGPQEGVPEPGDYPTGGPVARMIDVWQAGAPSLTLLAPDIYIEGFADTLAEYDRADNPIFIPEARADAGNLFVALGQFKALGFSPFGIEDLAADDEVFQAYRVLGTMLPQIAEAQADDRIRGFKIAPGEQQQVQIGGYDIRLSGPRPLSGVFGPGTGSGEAPTEPGYGMILQTGEDDFLIVGRGISPNFTFPGAHVEIDYAQEGTFADGIWEGGRTLNGDERYRLFPNDELRVVQLRLLRR